MWISFNSQVHIKRSTRNFFVAYALWCSHREGNGIRISTSGGVAGRTRALHRLEAPSRNVISTPFKVCDRTLLHHENATKSVQIARERLGKKYLLQ